MKILVTDGNNRAALAITRSLGRRGHKIIVGAFGHPSLASSSKYCSARCLYPDPINSPNEFIEKIIQYVCEKKIDVVLPVSDVTTIPICENKKKLEKYCHVPFADSQIVKKAAHKKDVFELAAELGLPIPKTIIVSSYSDYGSLGNDITFPVVIKPSRSRIKGANGWFSTSVKYADDKEELLRIIATEDSMAFPLLLQERIRGPGIGVFTCYNKGKPLVFFSHRRLREKPPSGGVSVLRESIPVSPEAKEYTERLLTVLGWHGVAMVEFKIDQRDNLPKLMEINGRFWGSLQLAIDAGVDFPALLIDTIQQDHVEAFSDYKIGVKTRWLLGDIDSLLMVLFKKKRDLKLPSGHIGRVQYLFNFLKLWNRNMRYEVLSLDDIKPWLYECAHWLKK